MQTIFLPGPRNLFPEFPTKGIWIESPRLFTGDEISVEMGKEFINARVYDIRFSLQDGQITQQVFLEKWYQ